MVIRGIYRRVDVFRCSGNIGAGDHHFGDPVFTQNSQQRTGNETGCTQAGDQDLRKNATGFCGLCVVAGGDSSLSGTLETRPFALSLYRPWPGSADMDNLLGVNRIPEKMKG